MGNGSNIKKKQADKKDPLPLIPVRKGCFLCPYAKGKKFDCKFSSMHKCKCNNPEFFRYYFSGLKDFGICKNCGHFIVKDKTGRNWIHSYIYYKCSPPYAGKLCLAPSSKLALTNRKKRIKKYLKGEYNENSNPIKK